MKRSPFVSCLWVTVLLLVGAVLDSLQTLSGGLGSLDEVRLVSDLFDKNGYNPLIRPVRHVNETIVISFSLALSQLITVDEKNQVMKTNVWLQMYWSDYQLEWDAKDYGDISSIRIRPELIWTPDVVLFNNADGNYEVSYKPNAVIDNMSNVTWIPPAIYQSSCTIDVEYFPFDQQSCEMKFGSWTFNGDQLTFIWKQGDKLDFTDYLASGTWDIVDCPGKVSTITEKETGVKKTLVVFTLILRRKTLFYTVNLIIPCVLISFVSVCVFALPADAGEKMTLCISILLALVVFLLLVSKILPPSLTIPLIAKYLLFTFIMNIFAIVLTVIIINRNYRTPRTHKMPTWIRVVFLYYLPKILFMERPDHDDRWQSKKKSQPQVEEVTVPEQPRHYSAAAARRADLLELHEIHHPNCKLNSKSTSTDYIRREPDNVEQFSMTPHIIRASEAVKFITQHLKNEDEYESVLDDWKYIAMVLDRLLLYIFLAVTFGGTVGILMNAPHIFEYVDQDAIIKAIMKENARNTPA
ncbi:acetylcholine receptor subunit beta-like 1 isoform X2 [Octopus vulgaris]|uniref:Acetylcholine receptor subunit beta-like 1 isoform X2 n=1 Tax=Octopus vulgaris TaxID=6645 RepID=A0AA36BC52_OCTVU|nr:acetylcholine receptor subunit beta-like 1 isoform X2 [Octopus vulgaris]